MIKDFRIPRASGSSHKSGAFKYNCQTSLAMNDLKSELASLRIDREAKPRSGWRWLAVIAILIALAVVAGFYFIPVGSLTATEVETVKPTVLTFSQAAAGSPILTASGYVVARRKAVVSAKIQGRLAELNVDESS